MHRQAVYGGRDSPLCGSVSHLCHKRLVFLFHSYSVSDFLHSLPSGKNAPDADSGYSGRNGVVLRGRYFPPMGLLALHIGLGIPGRYFLGDAEREDGYLCKGSRTLVEGAYGFRNFICRNLCARPYVPAAGSMLHDSQSHVGGILCHSCNVAVYESAGQMPGDGFLREIFFIYLRHAGHDFIWAYELHGNPEALAVLSDSRSRDTYSGGYCTENEQVFAKMHEI